MSEIRDPRTYAIIGAAMEVHRHLGCGFSEPIYQESMEIELRFRTVPFRAQQELPVLYKGQRLTSYFKPDFICFENIIVELKALSSMSGTEESQVLNYLKATGLEIGLLINFGRPRLEFQRFACSRDGEVEHSSFVN